MAETHATPVHAATRTSLLDVCHIGKVFGTRGSRGVTTTALSDLSFTVDAGEFVGIMGPSGSGKTTLLNCISTIDIPTSGNILLDGQDVTTLRGRQLARFRREQLGFVFQDANLVETLTGFENIALSLTIKGERPALVDPLVRGMAKRLGVSDVLDKYPN